MNKQSNKYITKTQALCASDTIHWGHSVRPVKSLPDCNKVQWVVQKHQTSSAYSTFYRTSSVLFKVENVNKVKENPTRSFRSNETKNTQTKRTMLSKMRY